MKPLSTIVLITMVASTVRAGELVTWTDVTGRYAIKAELKGTADGDAAVLVDKNGNEIRVPFDRLDRDSLLRICKYLNRLRLATDNRDAGSDPPVEQSQPSPAKPQEASVEETVAANDAPSRRPRRTRRRKLPPLDVRAISLEIAEIRDAEGRRQGWKLSHLRALSGRLSLDSGRKVQSSGVVEEVIQSDGQIQCRLRPPVFGTSVFPLRAKIDHNSIHAGDVALVEGFVTLDPKRVDFEGRWWTEHDGLGLVFDELVITNINGR